MSHSIQSMFVISAQSDTLADPLIVACQIGKRDLGLLVPASLSKAHLAVSQAETALVGQLAHAAADRWPGLNPLYYRDPSERTQVLKNVLIAFRAGLGAERMAQPDVCEVVAYGLWTLLNWRSDATLRDFEHFLADPVFRLQVIAALPEDVEGHAAMVFWCSRATTRAIGVRATAIETVHAFVADLLAQPGLARMLGQRQSTFCFFDLIAGGQVAVATPGPGTAAPAGQFFATWLAAAAYSAVTAYQVLALNQKIAFWLVVDLAFDLPISQWLDPSLAGGRDPGIHWVYTDDPLGMLSRSLKKIGSLSAAGGSPPPPVSPLSEAELARLDEAETRPNRQAQTTFIRTHYALGKPHGWADFQALRRRRDTQLYQALWQQPTLIEDPIERIYILSALKYGTPGYEIDLETTLTPAELAR